MEKASPNQMEEEKKEKEEVIVCCRDFRWWREMTLIIPTSSHSKYKWCLQLNTYTVINDIFLFSTIPYYKYTCAH